MALRAFGAARQAGARRLWQSGGWLRMAAAARRPQWRGWGTVRARWGRRRAARPCAPRPPGMALPRVRCGLSAARAKWAGPLRARSMTPSSAPEGRCSSRSAASWPSRSNTRLPRALLTWEERREGRRQRRSEQGPAMRRTQAARAPRRRTQGRAHPGRVGVAERRVRPTLTLPYLAGRWRGRGGARLGPARGAAPAGGGGREQAERAAAVAAAGRMPGRHAAAAPYPHRRARAPLIPAAPGATPALRRRSVAGRRLRAPHRMRARQARAVTLAAERLLACLQRALSAPALCEGPIDDVRVGVSVMLNTAPCRAQWGYFAFMAIESLGGSQLWERLLFVCTNAAQRARCAPAHSFFAFKHTRCQQVCLSHGQPLHAALSVA